MAAMAPVPLVSLFTEVENPRRPQARLPALEDMLRSATPRLSMAAGLPQLCTLSLRQQWTVPSVRRAQVWYWPADRDVKVPAGACNCPRRLSPQQWRVPSVRNPQV